MNEDGTMARLPQLVKVAKKFNLKLVSIEDLVAYRMQHDSLIVKKEDFEVQTRFGNYRLRAYEQKTNKQIHIALTKGTWNIGEPILTKINSTQVNNDLLGTLTNNADKQLDNIFQIINQTEKGAIIFINQDMQSVNMLNRITELKILQEKGILRAPKIVIDSKDYGIGAQILHDLDISKIRLISNTEQTKRVGMIGYGLEITEYVNY
jgi:3,4-dihydroxy 2-butanone 4-phosphate synthase/GTP cyclohydrolase II